MIEKKMRAIRRVPTNTAVRNIPPAKGLRCNLSPCRGKKDDGRAIFRTPEYGSLNDRKIGIGEEIATSSAAPDPRRLTQTVFSIFCNRDDSQDCGAKTPTRDRATPERRGLGRLPAIANPDATPRALPVRERTFLKTRREKCSHEMRER